MIFRKKFDVREQEYVELLRLRSSDSLRIFKRAIILTVPNRRRKEFYEKTRAKVMSVGDFMKVVWYSLRNLDPWHRAVPENYPTLRAIQFLLHAKRL